MTKKKAIILIIVAVALVGIAVVVYNFVFNGSKSVGINSSITNEDGKNPKVDTKAQKILVVYFSETGNTQALAKIISDPALCLFSLAASSACLGLSLALIPFSISSFGISV